MPERTTNTFAYRFARNILRSNVVHCSDQYHIIGLRFYLIHRIYTQYAQGYPQDLADFLLKTVENVQGFPFFSVYPPFYAQPVNNSCA